LTVFDAHCDTLQKITDSGGELYENSYHIDLKRIEASKCKYIQFFAAFIDAKNCDTSPQRRCLQLIDNYYNQLKKNKEKIQHCNTYSDIYTAHTNNKTAAFLSIEGGEALEGSLENLKAYYDMGVRMLTLTWNYDNEICGGIGENKKGLTGFGKQVVDEMNNLGIIIDVSHISEKGFWDVIERTKDPIVASHSNARKICEHKRNLTDEQIKEIINNGGCIGINFYPAFVSGDKCKIKDILKHIDYICSLGGENNIGIGSDFDGIERLPEKINGVENILMLSNEMQRLGYTDSLIKKLYSQNFLRILKKIAK